MAGIDVGRAGERRAGGAGLPVEAHDVTRVVAGGRTVLQGVTVAVAGGELVGIAGGSGAGKTTLLEVLAGLTPATTGEVRIGGRPVGDDRARLRDVLGYVPQDDIIHAELPLARTLRYAAELRLPATAGPGDVDAVVDEALRTLDLADRADVRVGALSGGQRKRASIAAELLTDPQVFFLDEPTSGLDPAAAVALLRALRTLADRGRTVVFTTHSPSDLARCDRIAFLGRGGHLVHVGTLPATLAHFGVDTVEEVYELLADDVAAARWGASWAATAAAEPEVLPGTAPVPPPVARAGPGPLRQWRVLSRRTFETLARNRLTLAILLGSPAMVVAMFAVLFRSGAFDVDDPSPGAIVMIIFWVAFGAFFFGLTYGLLQICTERAIVRREHAVGLRLGSYLASKVTVLLPFLVVVVVVMLGVLRALDRLPAVGGSTYLSVGVTLLLDAAAGLALGLLASAAVANPSQATLALPMLCFPAVLFSGAILPVHVMAGAGAAFSTIVPVRWAFEAVGHDLGVRSLLAAGGSPLGPPLIASYGDAGTLATGASWAILAAFTGVLLAATRIVLGRRVGGSTRDG